MSVPAPTKPLKEAELTITRTFAAPRALVFAAWTDARHLAQWWGPHGFTNPVCEIDPRVGGKLRIHMRGPDGATHHFEGVIRDIVAPERLVIANSVDVAGRRMLEGLITVTFAERDGKTTMTVHARAAALADEALAWLGGMNEGWAQSIERLEAFVARTV
jgi:uncharacterized protein YndB with AHSA1/START domain